MCSVTPPAQKTLPIDASAASAARAFLRSAGCLQHHSRVLDDALLLLSEVVANAVRHGSPPITAEVECIEAAELQIRVTDGNPYPPQPRTADLLDGGGRGLHLVDMLSLDWGVDPTTNGKVVWFRLRQTDDTETASAPRT